MDIRGDAIVVWQDGIHGNFTAVASISRPGRSWQKPARISKRPALTPHVVMDARGDATVVWEGPRGSVVAASKTLTGHRWSPAKTLDRGGSNNPYPQMAVDPSGDAIVTWSGNPVEAAVRRGRNGRWQRAVKLGHGGVSQAAIAAHGHAIVVWQDGQAHAIVIKAASYTA
ncbi:MAG: hypothetical protein ACR2QA_11840 [Solirubrobacteraceae bacterium]